MLRRYTNFDYQTIKGWSDARGSVLIPQEYLPLTGFVHEGHCAGFLYKTDTPVAILEWVFSNPASNSTERNTAMNELINGLVAEAKKLGFKMVFTFAEHKKLIERYQSLGFQVTDKEMTHMMRGVN
jgi:hypothetical protein